MRKHKGKESFFWLHTSAMNAAPLISFADILYKLENYGAPLSYDDMTLDVLRTESGKQWGPLTIGLPQLTKKSRIPTSRYLGLLFLNDIETSHAFLPPKERTKYLYSTWRVYDEFDKNCRFNR